MDPERSLAIFAATYEASCLVAKLGQMVREIRDNRADQRCEKLSVLAQQIQTLLEQRPEALNSHNIAEEARRCVADIYVYVANYTPDGSLLGDAMEVLWNKRYKKLVAAAERVKERFVFGLLSLTDFHPMARLGPNGTFQPKETFEIPNTGIIKWGDQSHSRGSVTIDPFGSLVCYKFNGSKISVKSLEIYPWLQDGAHVQQLKGLAKVNGELYIFLQDCSSHAPLSRLCDSQHLPSDLVSRVEIVFKIAKTVARYHKSGLVLKALCDTTIFMEQTPDNKKEPILTELQNMRDLHERSAGLKLDRRYEAPEYDSMRQHTLQSDIWSLGIIGWQVICQQFPYDLRTPVGRDNKPEWRKISESQEPGPFPEDIPQSLAEGLRQCWNPKPSARPSAGDVATMLQEQWLVLVHEKDTGRSATGLPAEGELIFRATQAQKAADSEQPTIDLDGAISRASLAINQAKLSTNTSKIVDGGSKKGQKGGEKNADGNAGREGEGGGEGGQARDEKPLKVSIEDIKALLRAEKAECAYGVGACIWWETLDERTLQYVEQTRPIEYTSTSQNGRIAELALSFLLKAERGGYTDGRFEISSAYSLLSRSYKEKKSGVARP